MKALFLYNQTTCGINQIALNLGCSAAVISRVVTGQSPYKTEYDEYNFLQSAESVGHPLHKAAVAVKRLYEDDHKPSTYEIIQVLEANWPPGLDRTSTATVSQKS